MRLLAALVAVVLALPDASEACSQRYFSLFEKLDTATTVALVRVHAVPPRAGKVQLAVKGESDPDRIAALERCEKRLYWYTTYQSGVADHFWKELATACKTGTPTS